MGRQKTLGGRRFLSTDEYIDSFPEAIGSRLRQMRRILITTVPEAKEVISYNIPALFLHSNLVYYAGYKHHIGFYPMASAMEFFKEDIRRYRQGKGSLQFPLDEPLPEDLIRRIVEYRKTEDEALRSGLKSEKS